MDQQEELGVEIERMKERVFGKREQVVSEPVVEPTEVSEDQAVEPDVQSSTTTEDDHFATDQPTEETVEKKKYTDWKNRYKTYKASTDSTIHQLRRENITLSESNVYLSNKVDELNKALSSTDKTEDIYKNLLTEEEQDVVGETTMATIKKIVKAANEASNKPLREALEEERKLRLKHVEARASESTKSINDSFIERLEELAPTYVKYDTDSGFHNWMNEPDTYSGIVRSSLFHTAKNVGDAKRVAEFFNDYDAIVNQNSKSLDSNITPTKSSSTPSKASTKVQPKETQITRAFTIRFYDDCARGAYDGKEKLRQEIETKIKLALSQGGLAK